jgi:pimeloyl-ACP methyl ester carboxylesterase
VATGTTTTFGDFLACNRFDMRRQLAAILTPTLIISGAADQLTPPRFTESLAAGLPRARLIRLEEAGHYAMLDQPEKAAAAILAFLAEIAPAA